MFKMSSFCLHESPEEQAQSSDPEPGFDV